MVRSREIGVVLAVGSVLAGCLFPSFDDLGGAHEVPSSDAGNDVQNTDATSNDAGVSPSSPVTPQSKEAGTAPSPHVACGTAGDCDLSIEACCFTFGGPDCQPVGAAGTCSIQGSGHHLSCDGAEDCTGGDVCCWDAGEKKATCKASSACAGGKILCNGPLKLCAEGQGSCKGTLTIPSDPPTKYWTCE